MDLLYDAAVAWNRLMGFQYDIICGKKKKLYPVRLTFSSSDFYHLAGFPHMKDIVLPVRFSQSKALEKVLERVITTELVSKSQAYEKTVQYKLTAIVRLERLLNNCPKMYMYNRSLLPFYTNIPAKYLLVEEQTGVVFLFIDRNESDRCFFSRSAFMMDDHDFRQNQPSMTILKISRTDIKTNQAEVLYRRPEFEE